MVAAAEQGFLDAKEVKVAAIQCLEDLQMFVESKQRFREARYLLFFRSSLLSDFNDPIVQSILEKYLGQEQVSSDMVERALTLVDLAKWFRGKGSSESHTRAEICFSEAGAIFRRLQHKHGELDIEEAQLTTMHSPDMETLFRQKQGLAEKYFEASCYQNGVRVLIFGISSVLAMYELNTIVQSSIGRLEMVVEMIGGELLKQIVFIQVIATAILKAPEYGRALKSLEGYWEDLPRGIGPTNESAIATLLSQIYTKLGDLKKAVDFAQKSFEISAKAYSYTDKSEAAFTLALAYSDCSKLYHPGSSEELEWLQRSASLLEKWIYLDAEAGFKEGEQQKCFRLAELYDYLSQVHRINDATQRTTNWLKRGREVDQVSPTEPMLNYVVETQVRMQIRNGQYEEALATAIKACELCQKKIPTPILQLGQCFSRIATTRHIIFKSQLRNKTVRAEDDWSSDIKNLFLALEAAFHALKFYRLTNGAEPVVACTNHLWLLLEDIALFGEEQAKQISEGLLYELQETETFCDSVRRSAAGSENLQSLMEKRMLVSKKEHLKLYSAGVLTSLRLGNPEEAWLWTQKGKARALSDAFGFRSLVPDYFMHAIERDAQALKLYEHERAATAYAMNAAPEAYVGASRNVDNIRVRMMQIPILKQLLALKEGAFDIGIEDTQFQDSLTASGMLKECVKYIDWFITRGPDGTQEDIYLFVRQLGGPTNVRKLSIDAKTVKCWIRKAFIYPEGADPPLSKKTGNRLLAEMNNLVDGLNEYTSPDDLLILSPADFLNRIPLHGLKVDKKVLTDRNLIIYSSSSAVLRHCLIRANARWNAIMGTSSKCFLAVYEELSEEGNDEREKIYASVYALATELSGNTYTGTNVTKDVFRRQCQKSGWIHYHGHAFSASEDAVDSALILSDGTNISDYPIHTSVPEGAGQDKLTVTEIFNLPMIENAPHISIIACDSSTQDIAAGDEPLGIVSAMLFAGATSVLGCLWPIESFAGRMFSSFFYSHQARVTVATEYGSGRRTAVNLALALQLAVREMRKEERTKQPYYWAPFVLHGSWFWATGSVKDEVRS